MYIIGKQGVKFLVVFLCWSTFVENCQSYIFKALASQALFIFSEGCGRDIGREKKQSQPLSYQLSNESYSFCIMLCWNDTSFSSGVAEAGKKAKNEVVCEAKVRLLCSVWAIIWSVYKPDTLNIISFYLPEYTVRYTLLWTFFRWWTWA